MNLKNKKYFLMLFTLVAVFFSIFWSIKTYLHLTIINAGGTSICLHSVELGFFDYLNDHLVDTNDKVSFSDFFGISDVISISYSNGVCNELGKGHLQKISCKLSRKGSDSCLIYLHKEGVLDCSECYK